MSSPQGSDGTWLLKFDLQARRQSAGAAPAVGAHDSNRDSNRDTNRDAAESLATRHAAPLAGLADSLAADLEPLITAPLPIPECKARLTRIGGRCPVHGVLLEFDPFAPTEHVCARCQQAYRGREHDEWWAMGAQLWTAERAVHAAALYAVRGDRRHADLAARILREYSARYDTWPNRDNVLGPTRPFFSTYLESIWLLNLCHAVALLEATDGAWSAADGAMVRRAVLAPSATLINSYHEGRSNRQVWNEVAVMSAWRLLGEDAAVQLRLRTPGGLCALIEEGLLDDGTWYEGENYHLFAHRGLWYGVELMRALGEPLTDAHNAKYSTGFVTPFLGVLPDDTFPSRRDSQYASSIRQWRTAEWCELGWAHTGNAQLAGVLTRLYTDDGHTPRRNTGRANSTADAERNLPPTLLTRADLSWRALLMATPQAPPVTPWHPGSVYLSRQGLAVMRRDAGHTYVALEGGQLGGGHGHPDQLALTLQTGVERWLQDPGTGSYVSPSLHWYRSTLAHAAPAIDFRSQRPRVARTQAFDEQFQFGWMTKAVDGIADGVRMRRTVVVALSYLVDVLEWDADAVHTVTLPVAGAAEVIVPFDVGWTPMADFQCADATDPRSFLMNIEECHVSGTVRLQAHADVAHGVADDDRAHHARRATANVWYTATAPFSIQRAEVPGVPGQGTTRQHRIACHAQRGTLIGVWSWPLPEQSDAPLSGQHHTLPPTGDRSASTSALASALTSALTSAVESVILKPDAGPSAEITLRDGTVDTHVAGEDATGGGNAGPGVAGAYTCWTIESARGPASAHVRLESLVTPGDAGSEDAPADATRLRSRHAPQNVMRVPHAVALGESHYVPTERPWREAGAPSAVVHLSVSDNTFIVDVTANTGAPLTRALHAPNPLDNEPSAINCDGIQWYVGTADAPLSTDGQWTAAGIHVPDPAFGEAGYAAPVAGGTASHGGPRMLVPSASWHHTDRGWAMRLAWPLATLPLDTEHRMAFDLVVNECSADRERRRGQLVLSGGGGFGYLAGDRRPVARAVTLQLPAGDRKTTLR